MTILESNDPSVPEDEEIEGPGRLLREARQQRGLTIDDVSARLRLDAATLFNLEEDNYAQLPGPAFVPGYLRAYARFLDLDPGSVLERFHDRNPTLPPVRDIITHPEVPAPRAAPRIATYLTVFGLVALVFFWWHNRISPDPVNPDVLNPDVVNPGAMIPDVITGEGAASSPERPPDPGPASRGKSKVLLDEYGLSSSIGPVSPPVTGAPGEEGGAIGTAAPPPAEDSAGPEAGAPIPAGNVLVTTNLPPGKTTEAAPQPPAPPVEMPPAPQATSGMDHLVLRLKRDCWIEIYDRRGKRLYYQTGLAGKTYAFRGSGPFHVILGYARAVIVTYNGKRFDHTPYIQRELAEFSLGN